MSDKPPETGQNASAGTGGDTTGQKGPPESPAAASTTDQKAPGDAASTPGGTGGEKNAGQNGKVDTTRASEPTSTTVVTATEATAHSGPAPPVKDTRDGTGGGTGGEKNAGQNDKADTAKIVSGNGDTSQPHTPNDASGVGVQRREQISSLSSEAFVHITDGCFNKDGNPVGFHLAHDGIAPDGRRIDRIISTNSSNGTYRAEVSFERAPGDWEKKNCAIQTMFPNEWTKAKAEKAVVHAFNNSHTLPNGMWEGKYDGVTIRGYKDKEGVPSTAFPAPDQ